MHSIRPLSLILLILSLLASIALSSPAAPQTTGDPAQFQELLSTAVDADLHEVLQSFDSRFRDGVFHRDRSAMEAVHGEDPATATELVKLALKNKRQDPVSNATSSAPPPPPPPPPSATSPTTAPDAPTPTPTPTSEDKTSVVPPSSPTGASAISSTSGAVIYSNADGSLTTARSSAVLLRPTTTTLRRTTTLPDGSASTITSVVVAVAAYTTLSSAEAAASGTAQPRLQTGGASRASPYSELGWAGIVGSLALAMAL